MEAVRIRGRAGWKHRDVRLSRALTRRAAERPHRGRGAARTLFFPGCSLVNYAPAAREGGLRPAGAGGARRRASRFYAAGRSLSFEPGRQGRARGVRGRAVRARGGGGGGAHRGRLPELRRRAARRRLPRTSARPDVEVVAAAPGAGGAGLPRWTPRWQSACWPPELEAGAAFYEVCAEGARPPLRFSVHDSCPDRATGEFADGLRALLPAELAVEPAHVAPDRSPVLRLARAGGGQVRGKALEQAQARGAQRPWRPACSRPSWRHA